MKRLISIIMLVLIILVAALLHELAHYYAMKKYGIKVKEISMGVGPKLYRKKLKHTYFTIRLGIILGAYVFPENNFDIVKSKEHTLLQKIYIFLLGITVNFVISIITFLLYKCIDIIIFSELFSVIIRYGIENICCEVRNYIFFTSEINFMYVVVNLLPVLGISDGSKILKILIKKFIPEKFNMISTIMVNVLGTILCIIYYICGTDVMVKIKSGLDRSLFVCYNSQRKSK